MNINLLVPYTVVPAVAMAVSGLTLFSGFGLGTLLMPVFAIFFPIEVAIAATAVVHLANNLFKLGLLVRHADWGVVARFAIPGALMAVVGAQVMKKVKMATVRWIVGVMLIFLAIGLGAGLI